MIQAQYKRWIRWADGQHYETGPSSTSENLLAPQVEHRGGVDIPIFFFAILLETVSPHVLDILEKQMVPFFCFSD